MAEKEWRREKILKKEASFIIRQLSSLVLLYLSLCCLGLAGSLNFSLDSQTQPLLPYPALSLSAARAASPILLPNPRSPRQAALSGEQHLSSPPKEPNAGPLLPHQATEKASSRHLRQGIHQPTARSSTPSSKSGDEITITITYPPLANRLTTPYRQIFVEGKICAPHGLRRIEFNGQELFNKAALDELIRQNWSKIESKGERKTIESKDERKTRERKEGPKTSGVSSLKPPPNLQQSIKSCLERYSLYYLHQLCSLTEGENSLKLLVEDNAGQVASRILKVHSAPAELTLKPQPQAAWPEAKLSLRQTARHQAAAWPKDIPLSQERMILALLPPLKKAATDVGSDSSSIRLADYIYHRLGEAISRQARFRLVERAKLPWLLIEKAIQSGNLSWQQICRQISHLTPADVIMFIEVQRSKDSFGQEGLDIQGRLVNLESTTLAIHRVFVPTVEPQSDQDFEELNTAVFGLAMKFRDCLPLLTGTILSRSGSVIKVDLGSEKGVLCGMCYNIYNNSDGKANRQRRPLCRAIVKEVAKRISTARIIESELSSKIRPGCIVMTR
ncbi:MAG: hypothetical protein K6U11_05835 [bacterium]|nr:hypothetical protein [bacterium]